MWRVRVGAMTSCAKHAGSRTLDNSSHHGSVGSKACCPSERSPLLAAPVGTECTSNTPARARTQNDQTKSPKKLEKAQGHEIHTG